MGIGVISRAARQHLHNASDKIYATPIVDSHITARSRSKSALVRSIDRTLAVVARDNVQ